jgi:hypothetical protein
VGVWYSRELKTLRLIPRREARLQKAAVEVIVRNTGALQAELLPILPLH